MSNVTEILAERKKQHGSFSIHAAFAQRVKAILYRLRHAGCERTAIQGSRMTIADLVRAMHDIDAMQGRCCGTCFHLYAAEQGGSPRCHQGMAPYGPEDGCEKWRQEDGGPKRQAHPWPANELGEPS